MYIWTRTEPTRCAPGGSTTFSAPWATMQQADDQASAPSIGSRVEQGFMAWPSHATTCHKTSAHQREGGRGLNQALTIPRASDRRDRERYNLRRCASPRRAPYQSRTPSPGAGAGRATPTRAPGADGDGPTTRAATPYESTQRARHLRRTDQESERVFV